MVIDKFANMVKGGRVVDAFQLLHDKLVNDTQSVKGFVGSLFTSASNGSTFIGMDYNQVENIRASIRAYVGNIQKVAASFNETANASTAVHGEAQEATQLYLKSINEITDAWISSLLMFSDKMVEYCNAYKSSDAQLASNISDEAKALSSSASDLTYVEKN